jgi:hypothetical protein
MRPIIIHRKKEKEMKQAIQDLTARGFKVIYGPVHKESAGKQFTRDSYGRAIFLNSTQNCVWIAKLQKVES